MTKAYSPVLFWLGMTISASLMLYHTSDRVTALDRELRSLNAQVEAEQESLHVLKAEWVYLANPARIKEAVGRHLTLQPTAPRRVAALQNMSDLLPLRDGVDAVTPVLTAQAAPVEKPATSTVAALVEKTEVHSRHDRVVASLNAGRINDHMVMQHAAVEASTDRIGALIGTLGLHP